MPDEPNDPVVDGRWWSLA